MRTFQYTDDQWLTIAAAIPNEKSKLISQVKDALREAVDSYMYKHSIAKLFEEPVEKRSAWAKIEKQCAELSAMITSIKDWEIPFPDWDGPDDLRRAEADRQSHINFLMRLAEKARATKAYYVEHASTRNRRIDPDREDLYRAVIAVWADLLGERLTISPTGPWPRFFRAALLPVLQKDMPASGSLKGIVEREKDRRSPAGEQDQAGEVGARG